MVEVQIEHIVLDCNRLAMENLMQGNLKGCLHLLRRAQDIMNTPDLYEGKNRLMVITLNNLGCYHKANKKFNLALQAFQKALDLKSDKVLEKKHAAEIHINMCWIRDMYSQFENLIFHAKTALELLRISETLSKDLPPLGLYFLGKGLQGIDQLQEAMKAFKQGLELSYKDLGHVHPTTCMLLKAYLNISAHVGGKPVQENLCQPKKKEEKDRKKYYFEHSFSNAKVFYNKNTPVKAEKRSTSGLEFFPSQDLREKSEKKPKKYLENLRDLASSVKPHNCLRNSEVAGKITPEIAVRAASSQSKRPPKANLPKIRSVSGRHRSNASIDSTKNSSGYLHEGLYEPCKGKSSEKVLQPVPPVRKKPPSSARAVHFRKPSFESFHDFEENKPEKSNLPQILLIQKVWRGYKARKLCKVLKRKATTIKAQKAIFELEQLQKQVKNENFEILDLRKSKHNPKTLPVIFEVKEENPDGSIVLIQKNVRMFIFRKKFMRKKKAAIKIQSFLRMRTVQNLYQNILSAITFIQRIWRVHKS